MNRLKVQQLKRFIHLSTFLPFYLLAYLPFVFCSSLSAQTFRPQTARPFGMGSAFCAVSNDFNAVFFNPAGLGRVKQIEASALLGRFLAGDVPQTEGSFSGTFPLTIYNPAWDYGVFGAHFQKSEKSGEIASTHAGLSWGNAISKMIPKRFSRFPVPENLFAGLSLGGQESKNSKETKFELQADLGFLYQFRESEEAWKSGWSLAVALLELNPKEFSSLQTRFGAAWKMAPYLFALDLVHQNQITKIFPGMEVSLFRKLLFFRLGTGDVGAESRQLTLGLGTVLPPLQIDLAYGFPIGNSGRSNDLILISLTYRFGSPLLSQYLYEERLEKLTELEQKVANLEAKKSTLQSAIREQKNIYEVMQVDMKIAKSKTESAEKERKESEEKLAQSKKEIEKIEEELKKLQTRRSRVQEAIRQTETPKIEVRPPHTGPTRKHKVAAGDSLRGLAQTYYGDANKWQVIYEANEDKIIRGVPREGEELTIP